MGAQQNQSKSEEEMFNWSDVHLYWSNFLQNLYFSCTVFNYRRKRVTRNNSYLCNSLSNRGLPYNSKVKNSLFCPRKKNEVKISNILWPQRPQKRLCQIWNWPQINAFLTMINMKYKSLLVSKVDSNLSSRKCDKQFKISAFWVESWNNL